MLNITSVDQFYGESHILRGVDLVVPQNQCTCLMGRNGVGKTTLLLAVMGLLPVRAGSIALMGENLLASSAEARASMGIGYVPQGRQIFPLLTVEENLRVGLAARKDQRREIPGEIFELFPVLFDMRNRRGGDLSGGQQQQLAIGRALAIDPKLLILDEPAEGIQPNIVREIGDVIRMLVREAGITVLLVEQKLPFARRVADTFSILVRGSNVAQGKIGDLSDALVAEHLNV
ncbi:MAG: urea ABC transporter ATP-binding subunit UrtE [Granulosicoccus sp.]|nr:urea ABC transporter ATP-binding subunit UrtE [Granulosicoccus sp.]